MKKQACTLALAAALLALASASHAQSYDWAQRTGGTATGATAAGVTNNWTWSWAPGGVASTGTVDITRTGAGSTYSTSEAMAATITAATGTAAPAFNNSVFANTAGGVNGIRQFLSEGELARAANDVSAGAISTTVMNFTFDGGKSSPYNTQITLFDPGSIDTGVGLLGLGTVNGPFSYKFSAALNGVAVDTSTWVLRIEDPYLPANNQTNPNNFSWNGSTLSLSSYAPNSLNANFPDTIVFLDTGNTTFDKLTVTAVGLATDTFAIGFGANTAPVPEPATAALAAMGLLALRRQIRRAKAS